MKNNDPNVKIYRFASPFVIGNEIADVLITVKESIDKDSKRIYSLELTEIKKLSAKGNSGNTVYYTDSINKLHQKHEKIKSFFEKNQKNLRFFLKNGENAARFAVAENKPYYQIPFDESVDAVMGGNYKGNGSIFMRDTPSLFADLGFPKLPIMTTSTHIKSIYSPKQKTKDHNHDLGELIKQIPGKLENPLMIITSKTQPDTSVVVILELADKNNNPVIVPILLNGRADLNRIDAHIMTSAYGKKNVFSNLAAKAVESEKQGVSSILYASKKAEAILNTEGVQFPDRFTFDSAYHNISQVGIKVKPQTETLQFKNWFKDSKVVDENGEPLIVYHGTNADFTVFDTEKFGAWFSKSMEYAESMMEERGGELSFLIFSSSVAQSAMDDRSYGAKAECFISEQSGDASYCGVKRNNAS
ncbi:MAG: hypothetical protein IJW31_10220 [Lentisphaeria bacterium]|nr:hypothetical protein [Lentisphaeria bacterium]